MSDPVDPTVNTDGLDTAIGVSMTVLWIILGLFVLAFILVIFAIIRSRRRKPYLFPWWGHLLMFLVTGPLSIVTSSIEIANNKG
jgi:RsiW-degrading membrane proteinase PrsW (M82 family)